MTGYCWEMQAPLKHHCRIGWMSVKKQQQKSSTSTVMVTKQKKEIFCTCLSPAVHPPISRLELAGELGPLLLVLPLQVADGEWDALLTVCSQTSALRGGCGACWWRQRAERQLQSDVNLLYYTHRMILHLSYFFHYIYTTVISIICNLLKILLTNCLQVSKNKLGSVLS